MQVIAPANLTPREMEIVRLIAEGMSNGEIAAHLDIALPTANTHRKNILRKLGLKNTALLIRHAVEQGWLE